MSYLNILIVMLIEIRKDLSQWEFEINFVWQNLGMWEFILDKW